MTLSTKAYAKINLHLDVTGRLENGYHTISSIMQQISLYDIISVTRENADSDEKTILITCTEPTIPTDRRNIVFKCAAAFFDHFGIGTYRVHIHIDKRIPYAAGLAGGSTDGAAVLKLLPTLFDIPADPPLICAIGSKVGADIPFCIAGGTCLAEGIGEKLTPMKRNFHCPILVAIGGEGISTPDAYGRIDALYGSTLSEKSNDFLAFLSSDEIPSSLYNIFESVILPTHTEAREIKDTLLRFGAMCALMSGSGPSVFGLFQTEEQRDIAYLFFEKNNIRAYSCSFVD